MFLRVATASVVGLFALTGCAAHQEVVQPAGITLSQAMKDTVNALADAREESDKRGIQFGI
jgi:hypothetical protein